MRALWVCTVLAFGLGAQDAAIVQQDVMTPMRDGVKLATDIYLPAADGKFPVVLVRTPYNKAGLKSQCAAFAAKGYACVAQYPRAVQVRR